MKKSDLLILLFTELSLLFSVISLQNCVPALKVDKICDLGDSGKYIRDAFILRTTTNQEFYCNVRIRDRVSSTGTPTGSPQLTAPTISFTKTLYSGFVNEPYNITPTVGGDPLSSCTVAPALPAGLNISATTCAITGTATTAAAGPGASYTITATNSFGSVTASTKIKVVGTNAFRVYGQGGSFTTGSANNPSQSENSLNNPRGVAIDPIDNVYISDALNRRVLFYSGTSTTATRVYGQANYTSAGSGCSITTLGNGSGQLRGIAVDSNFNLYIADFNGNRVLRYPNGSTTPNKVFGQADNYGTCIGSAAIDNFSGPFSVFIDSSANMYISENQSNRVLFYPSGAVLPTLIYGQPAGNFTCQQSNSASGSCSGAGVGAFGLALLGSAMANATQVFIVDQNSRVKIHTIGNTTASIFIGQTSDITTLTGATSNRFTGAETANLDSEGNLYVADSVNHRVMIFKPPFTTNMNATYVLGQGASLTNFTAVSATTINQFSNPAHAAFDSFGNVYISDRGNNRVLVF